MLIASKISKKKLAAYIIIILAMFAGIVYFLYKNYIMTAPSDVREDSTSVETEQIINTGADKEDPSKEENIKDNPYYISIFDNPKFQSLIDNTASSSSSPVIGKKNPFVPN
jgi:hypothetical protein